MVFGPRFELDICGVRGTGATAVANSVVLVTRAESRGYLMAWRLYDFSKSLKQGKHTTRTHYTGNMKWKTNTWLLVLYSAAWPATEPTDADGLQTQRTPANIPINRAWTAHSKHPPILEDKQSNNLSP